jgi:hypothetical protein
LSRSENQRMKALSVFLTAEHESAHIGE